MAPPDRDLRLRRAEAAGRRAPPRTPKLVSSDGYSGWARGAPTRKPSWNPQVNRLSARAAGLSVPRGQPRPWVQSKRKFDPLPRFLRLAWARKLAAGDRSRLSRSADRLERVARPHVEAQTGDPALADREHVRHLLLDVELGSLAPCAKLDERRDLLPGLDELLGTNDVLVPRLQPGTQILGDAIRAARREGGDDLDDLRVL